MKKITLSFIALAFTATSAISQDFEAISQVSTSGIERAPDAVLWHQPNEGGNGIVTGINNLNVGVFSADDFVLTQSADIETLFAIGFNNNGNLALDLLGVNFYIYGHDDFVDAPDSDPSIPGSGLLELEMSVGDPGLVVDFSAGVAITVDLTIANGGALSLPAGRYWFVVAPVVDIPDFNSNDRFNWFRGTPAEPNTFEAHLIDVSDFFGGGFTSWTPLSNLGITDWSNLAFTVEGSTLSIGDNSLAQISLFPNPTSDFIYVRIPSSVEITNSSLMNVLGSDMGIKVTNNIVDLSGLGSGVYLLSIETTNGSVTKRIIKK